MLAGFLSCLPGSLDRGSGEGGLLAGISRRGVVSEGESIERGLQQREVYIRQNIYHPQCEREVGA